MVFENLLAQQCFKVHFCWNIAWETHLFTRNCYLDIHK